MCLLCFVKGNRIYKRRISGYCIQIRLMKHILAEIFRLTERNRLKSNDLDEITEKKTLIFKKTRAVSNISGISPFIFQVL